MASSRDPKVRDNGPPCSEDDAKKLLILGVFGAFESGVRAVFFLRGIENVSFKSAFLLIAGSVAVVARDELLISLREGENSCELCILLVSRWGHHYNVTL